MLHVLVLGVFVLTQSISCHSCPLEYYTIDPNHSYCIPKYPDVIEKPVTHHEREYILRAHNNQRQLVRASDMQKMYWSEELATIALHYARACIFKHDTNNQRSVPRIPLSTGQNLAMGYENWTQALNGWIEEKQHYNYGYPSTGVVGHYTQMVWDSAVLVGCAAAICPPSGMFMYAWPHYVCNYITGQLNSNIRPPYQLADHDRPLNDCHGKVCLYNGILDLNTCQCNCSSYGRGDQCEYLDCNNLPPCYYPQSACVAINVPLECPRLCGLCDRYEILKQVYRENNVAPHQPRNSQFQQPITTSSTTHDIQSTVSSPFKRIPLLRKPKKTHSTQRSTAPTTTTTEIPEIESLPMIESSASTMDVKSIIFYVFFVVLLHSMNIICGYLF